jgi:PAS domain S-box-containing protein
MLPHGRQAVSLSAADPGERMQSEEERLEEQRRVRSELADHRLQTPRLAFQDPLTIQAILAAIVDFSEDAIVAKDLSGTILAWNTAAERIFGYAESEVLGLPITILIPKDRLAEEDVILASLRRGERIEHFETERVRKDGRRIQVSLSISPIRDMAGTIVGVAKIARDISYARQAQSAQATLAAIVASSDDAIVGKTLDGVIRTWNAGAERMFGYTADEAIGQSITMLLPTERLAEEQTILSTLVRGERIEHFETERVTKDGRRIHVSLSVSPIKDAKGLIVGAAKIARDVTLRRMLERERDELLARERAARAEAEASNRSKDAFLATISHELRTPLSPILTWTQLLRQGQLDREKSERALAAIERSARSQAQLIDDLLDVSRIVSGKLRIQVRPIDLVAVIQAAVEVVRPAAEAKEIDLELALDAGLGNVVGDPERLQQVVWNLLSNAIKFTPGSGRVSVFLHAVPGAVEILVRDTGQGFDPGFRPYIFDRFRQAEDGTTRQHGGLGLGLAIVRHLVELHGGTVQADSPGQGRGATFTVRLPLRARPSALSDPDHLPKGAQLEEGAYPALKAVRLLVVDDEPDSIDVVSTLLRLCGAEVETATGAAEALEVMGRWTPDLVITDIGMPGTDGYALLAAMQQREASLRRIPAIALTAFARREDHVRILKAGFQLHVTKPIDPLELVNAIANVARMIGKL